ncbi:hypothetical protein [Extensimonas vulgaris]|uniref:hypothetical protein n=1 Tax=Extensimonas vulgaris TaxID=1031594 RepID=UPI001315A943|nr:hypothetical protein [Extensimonas vulgaris]
MGRTVRQIAALHGVGLGTAWRVSHDVPMLLLPAWHRKRLHEEPCTQNINMHSYLAPR